MVALRLSLGVMAAGRQAHQLRLRGPTVSGLCRRLLSTVEAPLVDNKVLETVKPQLKVSLIGRPNTGKSTLFNRLTRSKMAIVSPVPGTTRDRREGTASLAGMDFAVVDTGGLDDDGPINEAIQAQVEEAIKDSHLTLFVIDAKAGITPIDEHFSRWIRQKARLRASRVIDEKESVILLANKCEGAHLSPKVLDVIADSWKLGVNEPLLISASHGDGMADLAERVLDLATRYGFATTSSHPKDATDEPISLEEKTIQLSIMGRPNVGKSTLLNAIVGGTRSITGPLPGLTRDAVHVDWSYRGRSFRLVDTAGLVSLQAKVPPHKLPGVHQTQRESNPSQFSLEIAEQTLSSALNALRFSQVALLVVEVAQRRFSEIDLQIVRRCLSEGRPLVVVANKADLLADVTEAQYAEGVKKHASEYMRELGDIHVVSACSLQGRGANAVLDAAIKVHDTWSKRISTWVLNQWLKDLVVTTNFPRTGGGANAVRVKYMTQIKARPPTFAVFANVDKLPGFFERFLRSSLQRDFKFDGVPLRFVVRKIEKKQSAKDR